MAAASETRPVFRILSPRKTETGGPEALHQLCAALVDQGHDAAMHYVPDRPDNVCPPKYLHYGAPVSRDLPDRPEVVVVIPEVMTDLVWRFHHARPVIWWLSVDFYLARPTKWTKRAKRWLRERLPSRRPYEFQPHPRLRHANHGEYTRRYLAEHGVLDPLPLTEYIAPALTVPEADIPDGPRRNVCLYNPRKGLAFTEKLIAACAGSGIEFLPLIGYSEPDLRRLYGECKLYMDFGGHPGRERMPREAAASGCVIVTGRRGSAGNELDMPLPPFYKIDESQPGAEVTLRDTLMAVTADYDHHRRAQTDYRAWVRGQRDTFFEQAAAFGRAFSPGR